MRKIVLLGLLLQIFCSGNLIASEKIVIGTGLKPPLVSSDKAPGFLDTLAKEAFSRLGIELEVLILPAERALINANKGIEDGNLLRIKGLEKRYPNLIRVPEKMMDSEFVGYALGDIAEKPGWGRLSNHTITFVKGWKIFESNVKDAESIVAVGDAAQMFTLLQQQRADVALYEKWQGLFLARKQGVKNYHILEPPFVTMEMFMYLNKKHSALVPKVARVLKEMKDDGTYKRIFDQTLGTLLK